MSENGRSDTFKRRRKRRHWPLQAFQKNVRTKNRFRLYSGGRGCDSAHDAADDGRLRVWFVAVRWPTSKQLTPKQKDLDREARDVISHEMGHGREQITAVYLRARAGDKVTPTK